MKQKPVALEDLLVDPPRPEDAPVFWTPSNSVDWDELRTLVSGLAERLTTADPDRWVVVSEDGCAFTVGLLATWQADGVAMLPPNSKPGSVQDCMQSGDGLLTDRDALADLGPRIAPLEYEGGPEHLHRLDPKRTNTLLMTSGSTGERKIIAKGLKNFTPDIDAYHDLWEERLEDGSTVVSSISHQHAFGQLFKILWPLCTGHPIHPGQPTFPEDIKRCVQEANSAHLVTSPSPLKRLARSGELAAMTGSLKAIYSGGGVLESETVRILNEVLDFAPISVYGSTEAGGIAWRKRSSPDDVPPWTPFPGVEHRINHEGELLVRSPRVGNSLPEWYPTGDLAEAADEGGFFLRGRADRTVKVAEKRVSLPELEQHLADSPLVNSVAVVVTNDDDPDRRRVELGAAVVLSREGKRIHENAPDELQASLKERLDPYYDRVVLPRHWTFPETLPRDHMSKIRRDDLRERLRVGDTDP